MSDSILIPSRQRQKNLLIVEGHHEKEKLFSLLIKCFPEININFEDILIYGTNIYHLYQYIVDEYSEDWDDGSFDVDLPLIVSKKLGYQTLLDKRNFTNVILIFDYERHDPNFSETKLIRMQKYFRDASKDGQLYINYPMIESYQHFDSLPDNDYENRNVSVTLRPGQKYKNLTKDSSIAQIINLPQKMFEILNERFGVENENLCQTCVEQLLSICSSENMLSQIGGVLSPVITGHDLSTAQHQMADLIGRAQYANLGLNFYGYARELFVQIILHNIYKANKLQNGKYLIESNRLQEVFYELDWEKILCVQNGSSRDLVLGVIWVLNTCVTFIPEYRFSLIQDD